MITKSICTLLFPVLLFILLWSALPHRLSGQNSVTTYFMKSMANRTSLNPALQPEHSYLAIPLVLGNVQADLKTNTLNLDHLAFRQNGDLLSFMHREITADRFLSQMSAHNYVGAEVDYSLFSMGFYGKKGYWNIDLNLKAQGDADLPYEAFELLKKGFAMDEPSLYQVKNLRTTLNGYLEAGAAYSRAFPDKGLVAGVRAKVLLGLVNFNFHINEMQVDAGMEEWRIRSKATMQASAPKLRPTYDKEGRFHSFKWDNHFNISGYGMGIDLGAVCSLSHPAESFSGGWSNFLDKLTLSVAITDIGFVYWTKKSNYSFYSGLEDEVVTGNLVIDLDESSSLNDDIDAIQDKLKEIIKFREDNR